MIDTLKASKQLRRDGFSESQAQSIVNVIANRDEQLATKSDIDNVNQHISSVDQRLSSDIDNVNKHISSVDQRLSSDIDNVNKRVSLLQWMTGLCLTGIIAILILLAR